MENDEHFGAVLSKEEIRDYSLSRKPPLVNPYSAIDFEKQLQLVSFDLSTKDLETFVSAGEIGFDKKKVAETKPMNINKLIEENGPQLLQEGVYKIKYNEEVCFPDNMCALVAAKSSTLRCGCQIETAVWDPGYNGIGEGLLTVGSNGLKIIQSNPRLAQMVFYWTKSTEKYKGSFQYEGLKNKL